MSCTNCGKPIHDLGVCKECPDPIDPPKPLCAPLAVDGTFTNATVVVYNGCIVEVKSGTPYLYAPDPCCSPINGSTGGGSGSGTQGEPGRPGENATISIGTVTTGGAGTSAKVTNTGTSTNVVLNFTIPKGDKGDPQPGGTYNYDKGSITVKNGLVTDFPMDWPPIATVTVVEDTKNGISLKFEKDKVTLGSATITIDATKLIANEKEKWEEYIADQREEIENDFNTKIATLTAEISSLKQRLTIVEGKV